MEAPLKTKNAYRVIPLGEQALAVLQSQQEKTHSECVFPSPDGGPISPDSVRNMLPPGAEAGGAALCEVPRSAAPVCQAHDKKI